MNQQDKLIWDISDMILEVANLYNEVDTSDLQGIASAKARDIIKLLNK